MNVGVNSVVFDNFDVNVDVVNFKFIDDIIFASVVVFVVVMLLLFELFVDLLLLL